MSLISDQINFAPFFFTLFVYHFFKDTYPKERKIFFYLAGFINIVLLFYSIYTALNGKIEFSPDWELYYTRYSQKGTEELFSIFLLLQYAFVLVLIVRKAQLLKGRVARTLHLFNILVIAQLFLSASALFNGMGLFSNTSHVFVLTSGSIIISFSIVIVYFNNSRLFSSFLSKASAASLSLFFLFVSVSAILTGNGLKESYQNRLYSEFKILQKKTSIQNVYYYCEEKLNTKLKLNSPYFRITYSTFPQKKFFYEIFERNENKTCYYKKNYLEYRKELHDVFIQYLMLLFALTILSLLLLPVFFYRTITRPMRYLLAGMQEINRRNFEVEVPVFMRDEIGYLANSFNHMTNTIKDLTQNLEIKVKNRTRRLEKSFIHMKSLKVKQDADYYLSSLLLRPFSSINCKSSIVRVTKFQKQFKSIFFNHKFHEIGGDICIADEIFSSKNRYCIFANADAMGKSLQGAGGALVFGVAVKTHIEEAKRSSEFNPEIWIRKVYMELQKLFLSFEGTMLLSFVMGIVNERTGEVHFINIEHPRAVLYRDGIASFMENESSQAKLGHFFAKLIPEIQEFQLQENDIIIVGSDGRDDILIGDEASEINYDHNDFLTRVEEGKGDLKEIYNTIKNRGRLTDDLSLMKIEYSNQKANR
ncbi:MAG: SpoIIE family protein phosphatase [Leptospiraceae bacterium]|nr:SpoIIE family protein phosphatase [Leptospiraceae bacterium]